MFVSSARHDLFDHKNFIQFFLTFLTSGMLILGSPKERNSDVCHLPISEIKISPR